MQRMCILFCTATFFASLPVNAYISPQFNRADADVPQFKLTLPVVTTPFNLIPAGWPSMQQSLAVTKDLYSLSHYGVAKAFGQDGLGWREAGVRGFTLLTDVMLTMVVPLPGFEAWMHEEWHRAVMRRWRIDSYNGVYDMDIGASSIPVRKVRDDDLAKLKREHPRDMVRLPAAGVEASLELVLEMEKDAFFYDNNLHNSYYYILSYVGVGAYISSGADGEVDEMHRESNEEEEDIAERDFVGHDFNSWVYDLFRPDEAYEERGTHPLGNGINRYRDTSVLTEEEKDYLNLQGALTWLNLLDPFTLSINRFVWTRDGATSTSSFNTTTRHMLTSFGYVIDQNIFYRVDELKLLLKMHNYFNYKNYFPGLEAELLDWSLRLGAEELLLSLRAGAWLQPHDQIFKTARGAPGGVLGVRVKHDLAYGLPVYIDLMGKTAGWLAGHEYLERNFAVTVGVEREVK